jgi:hypothetical protein
VRGTEPDDAVGNAAELRGLKWHSLSISLLGYFFCATTLVPSGRMKHLRMRLLRLFLNDAH